MVIITVVALALAGVLAVQWVTSFVWSIIRLLMILAAFYAVARIGLYLLRNGGSRPA